MNYTVRFTVLADYDFDEIIDYISLDSPENAIKFVRNLRERIKNILRTTPNIGVRYKKSRFLAFKNYIVVYFVDESTKTVYVVLVSESHRQWKEILDDRV